MISMTVENYHLKWDSHHTHLNSSLATLYKNEKYADVVLYSSNSTTLTNNINNIPTVGISAHKFILSSCSQYFSTIFETTPVTNHGIFYIVLPPDLSYRAIQILVQYMYMGEATVSNDILGEVLRGGEILKIRGLCRANTTTVTSINGGTGASNIYNSTMPRMCLNGGTTSVRYLIEQQQQQHLRGLGASVLPKDSPVIMKSPKPLSLLTTVSNNILKTSSSKNNNNSNSNVGISVCGSVPSSNGIGSITINKEVAIDPEEAHCYMAESITTTKSVLADSSSICKEVGCNNCPLAMDSRTTKQPQQQHSNHSRNLHITRDRCLSDEPLSLALSSPLSVTTEQDSYHLDQHPYHLQHTQHLESHHDMLTRVSQASRCSANMQNLSPLTDNYKNFLNVTQQQSTDNNDVAGQRDVSPIPRKFIHIKEEPREWLTSPSLSSPLTICTNHIITTTAATTTAIETTQLDATDNRILPHVQHTILDFKLNEIKAETVLNTSSSSSCTANPDEQRTTDILSLHLTQTQSQKQSRSQPQTISSTLPMSSPCINDYEHYLSCDMCNETFEDLTSLLRHTDAFHATTSGCSLAYNLSINNTSSNNSNNKNSTNNISENNTTTTLAKSYVPKKRRRISESNLAEPVNLQCDLCNTSFEVAAEWVRHMNCQHTEVELAIFNSKKDKEHKMLASI